MDTLRDRFQKGSQQHPKQHQIAVAPHLKEQTRLIGSYGKSVQNITNELYEVDPQQWILQVEALSQRLQEEVQLFRNQLMSIASELSEQQQQQRTGS